jgi:hypothetical protein
MDDVMEMAAGGRPNVGPESEDEENMIATTASGEGYWTATHDGAVNAFGDALYKGNALGKVTGRIVGIAGHSNDGYVLLASDGGIFNYGTVPYKGRPDRV